MPLFVLLGPCHYDYYGALIRVPRLDNPPQRQACKRAVWLGFHEVVIACCGPESVSVFEHRSKEACANFYEGL